MNDELVFKDEEEPGDGSDDGTSHSAAGFQGGSDRLPWKILIVDDDEGVHTSTRFALERVKVDGRPLDIADAYSAESARDYLKATPDVALALVDVVMESEHAGLDLVRWVREDQKNRAIRLVLRTGQPGQAPERDVVAGYDIDDYKTKSDLTSQKLFSLLHASLRSYHHIRVIERNLAGLRKIITAASSLYRAESMAVFASGLLEQMTALLNLYPEAVYCTTDGLTTRTDGGKLTIVAATGDFDGLVGKDPYRVLPEKVQSLLAEALAGRSSVFRERVCVGYFEARDSSTALVYMGTSRDLSTDERDLIELFIRNMGLAFCGVVTAERLAGRDSS